ncbi:tRNA threonylcarbamoyladenosine biosynthesis protein TsaE [Aerococcus urinaehominis]|uniref:tRNA threonylcarbamoyladenosine biosynthesis protein TsaE n=1 Tax=Aerococcus urinaehominis TaxID=128944 RepID=A0A0X8FKD0_9LACT|nr:tRNA (adenosine(37)-N6)-threonylcarbamoyltransferase complex ATPase subunit type 1 TsaE [Aerococcus urinaehominis]AMB98926.1 tRNA threonylcarbamoyladenosine biosynthesis protein TsaE [Aerococcus urinaehominis]SDM39899.1 tRNA threonylcarbamoyladenosine biosynthesis protein TsaE [Aerococcus urinaehominis]
MSLIWENEAATQATAQELAQYLKPGDVICLAGDLGAGKTTFTQYLAQGLGIKKHIKSPTYTIIREYQEGRLPLYHMDAYRLAETGSEGIGLEEYLDGDGVCVIEWPQYIVEDLDLNYLWVTIKQLDQDQRQLELEGVGPRGQQLARIFKKAGE